MKDDELRAALLELRDTMISVSTGGPRINDANERFQRTYAAVDRALKARGIANTLPYTTLWDWYGRWSSGDMPTYKSRRAYVSDAFQPLVAQIGSSHQEVSSPTGWTRVDRTVGEIRNRLADASTEEQFQAVGLLCREALISLAQEVYDANRHLSQNSVQISNTDVKRMLAAYLVVELAGGANDALRKHAVSALDLSVSLQHKRTASFRDAAMCVEATTGVVNLIAIVSGRRDP